MHSVYEGFIARDEQLLSSKMQNATINSLRIYSWGSIVWAYKKIMYGYKRSAWNLVIKRRSGKIDPTPQ